MSASGCSSVAKPVIGITTYLTRASWGVWDVDAALVPAVYVDVVQRAGGSAVLVPPGDHTDEILARVDGMIFSGGSDIDPELYGHDPHPETFGIVSERDRFEVELLRAALERDLPVLAICRGSQVLNVALGGDLVQHLPDVVGDEKHKHTPGEFADHDVKVERNSRLGAIVGEHTPVKSHHHQGYGRIGDGLREVAWAEDGTVEALEDPDARFTLGVLWHPEESEDAALFEALVAEARRYAEERA
jgi:putative glutamine amidotransferase